MAPIMRKGLERLPSTRKEEEKDDKVRMDRKPVKKATDRPERKRD